MVRTPDQNNSITLENVNGKPEIVVTTEIKVFQITAKLIDGADVWGAIEPAGVIEVTCGEDRTFEFVPDLGYRLKTLLVDGEPASISVDAYTFRNVRANHTIEVEFEQFPYYIIQFGPHETQQAQFGGWVYPELRPNAVDFIPVDSATDARFIIQAADGFQIDQVFVNDKITPLTTQTGNQSGTYVFTNVRAHHTISATFKPIMHIIEATSDLNGNITPSGMVQVAEGTNKVFHAVPKAGYELTAINVDGNFNQQATQEARYEFVNVRENHTISAQFTRIKYQISTNSGTNGTISPENPQVGHGDNQTFTITPANGYKIEQVLIDGVENQAAALNGSYTFNNVTQEHTIAATFTKLTFSITATATQNGTLNPEGTAIVEYDAHSATYVFFANDGYRIQYVFIDGVNNLQAVQNGMFRFLNVTTNHTIHVVFAPANFFITATASTGGFITPEGMVTVTGGTDKVFAFAADAGFKLVRVMINGINNENAVASGTYTFSNVIENQNIAAVFERLQYNVTLPDMEGATVVPENGFGTSVIHGGRFLFKVALDDAFNQASITVRANNVIINPDGNGIYTIKNIVTNQNITIDGVEKNCYFITARAHAGGTIAPEGTFKVTHGDSKTFEMIPHTNFKVSEVRVDGVALQNPVTEFEFTNISADALIEVYFEPSGLGIMENEQPDINVFSYSNVITIINEELVPVKQVEIIDMQGRMVWKGPANGVETKITLEVAKGMYVVRIITHNNQQQTTKININ